MQGQSGGIEPIVRQGGMPAGEVKGGLAAGGLSSVVAMFQTTTGNNSNFILKNQNVKEVV